MDFETRENDRLIANVIAQGIVEEVRLSNPPKARVRVGELLTGWLRMATPRAGANAVWHPYEVGEEVMIACTSGDLRNGSVILALYNGANPARTSSPDVMRIDAKDGGYVEYNRASGIWTMHATGAVNIIADGEVAITSATLTHNGVNVGDTHTHPHGDPAGRTGAPS